MKKLFLLLLMAVAFCENIDAQKGMMGIGANLSVNFKEGHDPAWGGTLKYQYNISNYIRIQPAFSYYSAHEDDKYISQSLIVDGHFFFYKPKSFRPYLFLGLGYAKYHYYDYGTLSNPTLYDGSSYYDVVKRGRDTGEFAVEGGIGFDYRLSHFLSLQFEIGGIQCKELFTKASVGICYNF